MINTETLLGNWTKVVHENEIIFNSNKDRVFIDSNDGSDKIRIISHNASSMFENLKTISSDLVLIDEHILINITALHTKSPENLSKSLQKIYQVVSKEVQFFFEIIPSIHETLLALGLQKGINYSGLVSQKDNNVKLEKSTKGNITKLFESPDKTKTIYIINGRRWTKQIMESPQSRFNDYSKQTQYGKSSSVEYVSPSCIDGQITYIVVQSKEIYYPLEDRIVFQKSLLVKAGLKIIYPLGEPYDIKEKLLSFVELGYLDKEFIEAFF